MTSEQLLTESSNMSEAFITGSHAYGDPTEDSDVDLVVLVSKEDRELLVQYSGGDYPVRFDKLNLVLPNDEGQFNKWKAGTECLVNRRLNSGSPVLRDEAVQLFQSLGIGTDQYAPAGVINDA